MKEGVDFSKVLKVPGTYNYCGYTVIHKGNKVFSISDPFSGRIFIQDEILETKEEIDRIINLKISSR